MKAYSANYLFCSEGVIIENGIIVLDNYGKIIEILHPEEKSNFVKKSEVVNLEGILTPGFINNHCHLELSSYHQTIPTGCSIDGFIRKLEEIKKTKHSKENDIADADHLMWQQGIIAVADICNTSSTIQVKRQSKIVYQNFVEVFGSNAQTAEKIFNHAQNITHHFSDANLDSSVTPHSLYACSEELIELIQKDNKHPLSLHFMESKEENDFFEERKGSIIERAKLFHVIPNQFSNLRKRPSEIATLALIGNRKLLFVHNTLAAKEDIERLTRTFNDAWFCLCPNSNLYIENRLPDVEMLYKQTNKITLGTDSLASNKTLSILEEMRTIANRFPKIPTQHILKWATQNGAKYLGLEEDFGTLKIGKRPSLNLISTKKFDIKSAEMITKIE